MKCPNCHSRRIELISTIDFRFKETWAKRGKWRTIEINRTYRCKACHRVLAFDIKP